MCVCVYDVMYIYVCAYNSPSPPAIHFCVYPCNERVKGCNEDPHPQIKLEQGRREVWRKVWRNGGVEGWRRKKRSKEGIFNVLLDCAATHSSFTFEYVIEAVEKLYTDTCGRDVCVCGRDVCVCGRDVCVCGRDVCVCGRNVCVCVSVCVLYLSLCRGFSLPKYCEYRLGGVCACVCDVCVCVCVCV